LWYTGLHGIIKVLAEIHEIRVFRPWPKKKCKTKSKTLHTSIRYPSTISFFLPPLCFCYVWHCLWHDIDIHGSLLSFFSHSNLKYFPTVHHGRSGSAPNRASTSFVLLQNPGAAIVKYIEWYYFRLGNFCSGTVHIWYLLCYLRNLSSTIMKSCFIKIFIFVL
jgi:hypothetical protein